MGAVEVMKDAILLVILCGVYICGVIVGTTTGEIDRTSKAEHQIMSLTNQCEKNLPRSHRCEIVAVPVKETK